MQNSNEHTNKKAANELTSSDEVSGESARHSTGERRNRRPPRPTLRPCYTRGTRWPPSGFSSGFPGRPIPRRRCRPPAHFPYHRLCRRRRSLMISSLGDGGCCDVVDDDGVGIEWELGLRLLGIATALSVSCPSPHNLAYVWKEEGDNEENLLYGRGVLVGEHAHLVQCGTTHSHTSLFLWWEETKINHRSNKRSTY